MSAQAGLAGFNVHADPSGLWKKAELDYQYKKDFMDRMERVAVRAADDRRDARAQQKEAEEKAAQAAKARELWEAYSASEEGSQNPMGFIDVARDSGVTPEAAAQTFKSVGAEMGMDEEQLVGQVREAIGPIEPPQAPPQASGQQAAPKSQNNLGMVTLPDAPQAPPKGDSRILRAIDRAMGRTNIFDNPAQVLSVLDSEDNKQHERGRHAIADSIALSQEQRAQLEMKWTVNDRMINDMAAVMSMPEDMQAQALDTLKGNYVKNGLIDHTMAATMDIPMARMSTALAIDENDRIKNALNRDQLKLQEQQLQNSQYGNSLRAQELQVKAGKEARAAWEQESMAAIMQGREPPPMPSMGMPPAQQAYAPPMGGNDAGPLPQGGGGMPIPTEEDIMNILPSGVPEPLPPLGGDALPGGPAPQAGLPPIPQGNPMEAMGQVNEEDLMQMQQAQMAAMAPQAPPQQAQAALPPPVQAPAAAQAPPVAPSAPAAPVNANEARLTQIANLEAQAQQLASLGTKPAMTMSNQLMTRANSMRKAMFDEEKMEMERQKQASKSSRDEEGKVVLTEKERQARIEYDHKTRVDRADIARRFALKIEEATQEARKHPELLGMSYARVVDLGARENGKYSNFARLFGEMKSMGSEYVRAVAKAGGGDSQLTEKEQENLSGMFNPDTTAANRYFDTIGNSVNFLEESVLRGIAADYHSTRDRHFDNWQDVSKKVLPSGPVATMRQENGSKTWNEIQARIAARVARGENEQQLKRNAVLGMLRQNIPILDRPDWGNGW